MEPFIDPVQTIADLRSAVAHMETHQWGQDKDYDITSNYYCVYGSIRAAVGGLVVSPTEVISQDRVSAVPGADIGHVEQTRRLRDRASNCARAFYRVIGTEITVFNDTPGRTKAEVIAALEKTIAALEKNPNRA